MLGCQPPPRIKTFFRWLQNCRWPFGVISELIWSIPNLMPALSEGSPPISNSRWRSYKSCAPSIRPPDARMDEEIELAELFGRKRHLFGFACRERHVLRNFGGADQAAELSLDRRGGRIVELRANGEMRDASNRCAALPPGSRHKSCWCRWIAAGAGCIAFR